MSVIRPQHQGSRRNSLNSVKIDHVMVHSHRIQRIQRIQRMLTSLRQFDVIHGNMSHFKPSKDALRDKVMYNTRAT